MKALRCAVFLHAVSCATPVVAAGVSKRGISFLTSTQNVSICLQVNSLFRLKEMICVPVIPSRCLSKDLTSELPAELGCFNSLGPLSCGCKI